MRQLLWFSCAALFCGGLLPGQSVSFDRETAGKLPPGWTQAMTHAGGAPLWAVTADPSAPSAPNVLAQLSNDKTGGRFPLAIYDRAELRDGDISVKCKPISGEVDQACGIVWRYQNPQNYYIVRANAKENNVVLYKVENDVRLSLAPKGTPEKTYGVKHPVPRGVWSELKVVVRGNSFTVYFGGERLFEVEDSTFPGVGKTGLWTKADSVTHFDDFTVVKK